MGLRTQKLMHPEETSDSTLSKGVSEDHSVHSLHLQSGKSGILKPGFLLAAAGYVIFTTGCKIALNI